MKDLQEMNLVDDFQVNSLTSHKTYDPFDRDRMVYTIRNCCVEEPDLPYEDGAETLFLYTKGTKGDRRRSSGSCYGTWRLPPGKMHDQKD